MINRQSSLGAGRCKTAQPVERELIFRDKRLITARFNPRGQSEEGE
jgi:hypothetical protein